MALRRGLPLVAILALAGCGGGDKAATTTAAATQASPASGCTQVAPPPAAARTAPKPTKRLDPSKTYDVTLTTNCGSFTIRLDVKGSPATSASFASLVRHGFFDRTVFHRIIPGYIVQGGDPTATGTGGPGYKMLEKPRAGSRYTHGVVAMAKTRADPAGTSGSQFFIITGADAQLPPDYAILGKVTKGIRVVDRIGTLGDPSSEQPTATVEIEHATVSAHK